MDKSNFICVGPAQDLFCDLELYVDNNYIEVRLLLLKKIIIKKWSVPKEGLAISWIGKSHGSPYDHGCNSYIGFLMLDGSIIKLPMMQLRDTNIEDKHQLGIIKFYRGIIEQVIEIPAIGIKGIKEYGIDYHMPENKFDLVDAKKYKKRLRTIYDETMQPGDTPEDVYARMKENNIQGKLLDMLQNDGFLYNRKYTWDKVYKKE